MWRRKGHPESSKKDEARRPSDQEGKDTITSIKIQAVGNG